MNGRRVDKDEKISKFDTYTFAIITNKEDIPVSIILKMGIVDIHAYTLPEYRNHGYMRSALDNKELYHLWEDNKISIKKPDVDDPDLIGRYKGILLSLWGDRVTHYEDTLFESHRVTPEQAALDYLECIDKQVDDNHKTLIKMIKELDDGNLMICSEEAIDYFNENFNYNLVL